MNDEITLLQMSIKGNSDAFEKIVNQYQSLVCAITFSGTGRLDVSEELAQETFLHVWKSLSQLKDLGRFRAWLCTIARNMTHNYHRQKPLISMDTADVSNLTDHSALPAETLIQKEELVMLEKAIMSIPEEYREPLVMFYRNQKSTHQVAMELGMNESTVRTRLSRARQMLREEVARQLECTLERSAPGKRFTRAVMVAVGAAGIGLTVGTGTATAAIASGAGTSAAASGGVTAAMSTVTAKIIAAAAAVILAVSGVIYYVQVTHAESVPTAAAGAAVTPEPNAVSKPAALVAEPSADVPKEAAEPQPVLPAETAAPAAAEDANSVFLKVHVFAEDTRQPLADAQLRVNRGCGCNCKPDFYKTDDKGLYRISFGANKPSYLSIYVSKPGYVPMSFAWQDQQIEKLGQEFSFYLPKGTKIGGVVQNEQGQPIASTSVILSMYGDESKDCPWVRMDDYTVTADPNGKWECDIFPTEHREFSVKLRHPDYANEKVWVNDRDYRFDDFYQQKSVLTMKDGVLLEGYVAAQDGRPIKEATVFTGEDRFDNESPKNKTDAEGHFTFGHFLPSWTKDRVVLTVQAAGFAPELKVIPIRKDMEPVLITLGAPQTLRVRVVDIHGKPVVGAGVDVDNWRDYRSLKWQSKTDADGRFVWNEAPADEVDIDIYKDGFMRISEKLFVAGPTEYEVVMLPPLVISGKVVDAETNEPIKNFTAVHGIQWEKSDSISWQTGSSNTKDFSNGQYTFTLGYPYPGHLIRIDAEGYLPAKSRVFASDEGMVTFDFKLGKGTGPDGVVLFSDGTPAEGADVYVVASGKFLHFENGKPSNRPQENGTEWTVTGQDGTFSFKGLLEDVPYKLVVLHEDGFADVSKKQWLEDPNIILQEWGRIEGTLHLGLKVAANQAVGYYNPVSHNNPEQMNYYYAVNVQSDNQGRFVIERVMPGRGIVAIRITSQDGRRYSSSGSKEVDIVSGQTTTIDIGGGGRIITGTLRKPDWAVETVDIKDVRGSIAPVQPKKINPYALMADIEIPRPQGFDQMTVAEAMQSLMQWIQSEEGQAFQKEVQKRMQEAGMIDTRQNYDTITEADGSFKVLDVLPGEYTLTSQLRKVDKNGNENYREPIVAELQYTFTVDEITEENQDIPIQLGVLEYAAASVPMEIHKPFADFSVSALGGGKLKPSDFRGQHLLLVVYSVTGGESLNDEMKAVRQIQDRFAGDERLVMMGLTMGGIPLMEDMVKKFMAEQGLTWKQGIIDGDSYEMMQDLKIQGQFTGFLIGPDGVLLAYSTKGQELYDAVAKAMMP
jgi:RNA polymerase sigma factor (sigma-70 family)